MYVLLIFTRIGDAICSQKIEGFTTLQSVTAAKDKLAGELADSSLHIVEVY